MWATKDTGLWKSLKLSFTREYRVTCLNVVEARWKNEENSEFTGSKYKKLEVTFDDKSAMIEVG